MITFSIILPVYNGEAYLTECIDSILRQTVTDFELIIVNDGSTDDSLSISSKSASADERIKIIDKANEGVSIARNVALAVAKGKYIYFVDSDDVLEENCLELFWEVLKKNDVDIVRADYQAIGRKREPLFVNKKFFIRKRHANALLSPSLFYQKILMNEFFLWVCVFKRSIIVENRLGFIPNCRFMEDAAFIIAYLRYCKAAYYIPQYVYSYRIHGMTPGHANGSNTKDLKIIDTFFRDNRDSGFVNTFLRYIAKKQLPTSSITRIMYEYWYKLKINILYLLCRK